MSLDSEMHQFYIRKMKNQIDAMGLNDKSKEAFKTLVDELDLEYKVSVFSFAATISNDKLHKAMFKTKEEQNEQDNA